MKIEFTNLTIYEVEEFQEILLDELKKPLDIELDFINVEKLDMTVIQLLISLKKSCDLQSKLLKIKNINKTVLQSLIISGCSTMFDGV